MSLTKWHELHEPGAHSLSSANVVGDKSVRFELRSTDTPVDGVYRVGLAYPKFTGFPQVPDGYPGGNGPFAIGNSVWMGLALYLPLDGGIE